MIDYVIVNRHREEIIKTMDTLEGASSDHRRIRPKLTKKVTEEEKEEKERQICKLTQENIESFRNKLENHKESRS